MFGNVGIGWQTLIVPSGNRSHNMPGDAPTHYRRDQVPKVMSVSRPPLVVIIYNISRAFNKSQKPRIRTGANANFPGMLSEIKEIIMKVKIGLQLVIQHGDMQRIRATWEEAEALGVDQIFVPDHFHAQIVDAEGMSEGHGRIGVGKNFESTTIQAAMAATTTRVELGCTVHAVGFRNPNLMADIARTIDHISGGRYILGMGSGYMQGEYDDYGYEFGTAQSRTQDLINAIPVIKARFKKLNPKPLRKIPIMIGSLGPKGMRLAAEHADLWHVLGPPEKLRPKLEKFKSICAEVGRDAAEVEISATCDTRIIPDGSYDIFHRDLGINSLQVCAFGPDFDLGMLREILQWRKALT